jgi:hypothetical protein
MLWESNECFPERQKTQEKSPMLKGRAFIQPKCHPPGIQHEEYGLLTMLKVA